MKRKASFLLLFFLFFLQPHLNESFSGESESGSDSSEEDVQIPLEDSGEGFQRPEKAGNEMPKATLTNVCLEPKTVGKCKLFLPRYFFNQESGQCERFGYGGCGRNGNNFPSLTACENRCLPHLKNERLLTSREKDSESALCELPPTSPGQNCRAYLPRWTFDSKERRCVQFIYSGCGATANMYLRKYECEHKCGNYEPNPTEVRTEARAETETSSKFHVCEEPLDLGGCLGMEKRYHFNKERNRCLSFTFSGCGGNDNNFQTGEECLRTCGGGTPAENVDCAHVICPRSLYSHYTSLGCTPIYDGDACCPTRYDCQTPLILEERRDQNSINPELKCQYKGQLYSIGGPVPEAASPSACRATCYCINASGTPRINCASIECPENFGIRPPGKENCTLLYRKGSCCAHDYFCSGESRLPLDEMKAQFQEPEEIQPVDIFRCLYDGKEYVEGERIELGQDTCKICTCQRTFNGTLDDEACEPVDCGIEIYYANELRRGCVPVYFQDGLKRLRCCPIGWECPDEQAEVVKEASLSKTVPPGPEESSTARIPLTVTFRPMNVPRVQIPSVDRYVTTEACGLPRDPGHCKGSRPRYYFNPLSKTCEPFAFSGCGGNQNNFVSLRDCLRICAENPPETGRFRSLFKAPTPDQSRTTYELSQSDPCTEEPKLGPCRGYFRRFYYSPQLDECRSFVYGGCHGNRNNFHGFGACTAFCQNKILDEYTDDQRVTILIPNENGTMEAVHQSELRESETSQRQIPVVDVTQEEWKTEILYNDPCSLPPAKGPCLSLLSRYFYDQKTESCQKFTYGGCGGNRNNFLDMKECEMQCLQKPEVEKMVVASSKSGDSTGPSVQRNGLGFLERCRLPMEPGSCDAYIPSYYYDVKTEACRNFTFGGCFGNANRFSTLEECESICSPTKESQTKPRTLQVMETGTPSHMTPPNTHRFLPDSVRIEEPSHLPTKDDSCSLPMDKGGDCLARNLRYYWNQDMKECLPFIYSGCAGNRNNFLTESDCLGACAQEPPIERITEEGVLTCSYGNEIFPLGGILGGPSSGSSCGRPICQCITPPALTCIQKECPSSPFPIQQSLEEETTKCAPVDCPSQCKKIEVEGCPTCDCNLSLVTIIGVPTISNEKLREEPCRSYRCPENCEASIDPESRCPTCDCSKNQDQKTGNS